MTITCMVKKYAFREPRFQEIKLPETTKISDLRKIKHLLQALIINEQNLSRTSQLSTIKRNQQGQNYASSSRQNPLWNSKQQEGRQKDLIGNWFSSNQHDFLPSNKIPIYPHHHCTRCRCTGSSLLPPLPGSSSLGPSPWQWEPVPWIQSLGNRQHQQQ